MVRAGDTGGVPTEPDRWSSWLLERRDAGCERQRAIALEHLSKVRDRVLAGAEPLDGATVLDVGSGDGLIGLGALDRVGPSGRVVFADVSEALLERCRQRIGQGLMDRARFLLTQAENLAGVADGSVDVVTTRSVLIYVTEKSKAFAAFARVLRPEGRISLFEPINRLMFPEPDDRFWGYEVASVADLASKVKAQFVAGDTAFQKAIRGFDDRDLVRFARAAGFERVHAECHITIEPGSLMNPVNFEALLDSAPNPNAPTTREAIAAALTKSQQKRFLAELERAFSEGKSVRKMAGAYLVASGPPASKRRRDKVSR
jgi:ubiquinone/menaquinone biosynthesis C-methylase UbiE